jgi:hypothetical protein
LSAVLKARLESLGADVKGKPFEYFFCPFLFRDENVSPCEGHVLNKALGVGKSIWTVQRKDVDSFFGSRFEADLTKLQYRGALSAHNVLSDGSLRRKLRPRLLASNRKVDFFIPQGAIPNCFHNFTFHRNSLPPVIGLKMRQSELEEALDLTGESRLKLDLRVGSLVSLLKASHLTQFA